jgi:two-component system, response regulator
MNEKTTGVTILLAEDDEDDALLIRDAAKEAGFGDDLKLVADGQELLDYLKRRGKYADESAWPFPDLILLDLNMPRKDGREALREIRTDSKLQHLPVVVLTTSQQEEEIVRSYDLGVAGYVVKPPSFEALVGIMKALGDYWLQAG